MTGEPWFAGVVVVESNPLWVRLRRRLPGTAGIGRRISSVMPRLDVPRDLVPMEAEPVDELPSGPGWLYEPKYDGFRCLAYRNGERVDIRSRNQKPLGRYFPELCAALRLAANLAEWSADANLEQTMRDRLSWFLDRALERLGD